MVLLMVDLVNSEPPFYGDVPLGNFSHLTGMEDMNMNHCLSTASMMPGTVHTFPQPATTYPCVFFFPVLLNRIK